MTLLSDEHSLWSRAEITRAIAGIRGDEGVVADSIGSLYSAGLLHIVGDDFLLATRAARALDQMSL